ncbi:hypothetical protein BGX38DRAFT_926846 [Terfezia claveryi]|nr:hypothetical protein BGX38DRAFT_926846 [Terfezia claveryi]
MRTFALFYLAIVASVTLAVPAPSADSDCLDKLDIVVNNLPPDDGPLGPAVGTEPGPTVPDNSQIINKAVEEISNSPSKLKRDNELKKRYTTLPLPPGWFYEFKNLNAATESSSYMTYKSLPASTPDLAQAGANFCQSVAGCTFFNIYTEKFGPNPADQVIKCSLYSLSSTAAQATNDGQWRDGYRVTISGSWGFSKTLNPTVPGYTAEPLDGAINGKRANPTDPDPYMGYASISATDPSLCASACEDKTAYDSRHPTDGTYRACNFFNFYILIKDGVPYKTICSFYIIPFDNSFAVNYGYSTSTTTYTIGDSWGYTRVPQQGTGGIVAV